MRLAENLLNNMLKCWPRRSRTLALLIVSEARQSVLHQVPRYKLLHELVHYRLGSRPAHRARPAVSLRRRFHHLSANLHKLVLLSLLLSEQHPPLLGLKLLDLL